MSTATITVKVINFANGVKYAKKFGGRFDPATKTWTLPATQNVRDSMRAAAAYGLQVVRTPAMQQHDAGCSAYYVAGAPCECQE